MFGENTMRLGVIVMTTGTPVSDKTLLLLVPDRSHGDWILIFYSDKLDRIKLAGQFFVITKLAETQIMGVLEKLNDARSFEQAQLHPSRSKNARRWLGPKGAADGFSDGYLGRRDLVLTSKTMKMNRHCREKTISLGRIEFAYHLDGTRRMSMAGHEDFKLRTPTLFASRLPLGATKVSEWEEGESETSLGLGFDPKSPPSVFCQIAGQIDWLDELLTSGEDASVCVAIPLTSEIEIAARTMLEPRVHPLLLQSYISAKAEELLCLTFEMFLNRDRDRVSVNAKHHAIAANAKRMLETSVPKIVTIEHVAAKLDISQRLLNQAFREEYGVSIHCYATKVRMSFANDMLQLTDRPLKQIAYEAGYNHASNFCIAFKNYFGYTPTEVRKTTP